MADPDIYSLFMGDEPTAQEQAAALAAALRQRQQVASSNRGAATLFGLNPLLGGLQKQAADNAQRLGALDAQDNEVLQRAGQVRSGQRLQDLLAARQQKFQGGQNALDRDLQRELEGIKNARSLMQFQAEQEAAKAKAQTEGTDSLRKEFNALPAVKSYNDASLMFDKLLGATNDTTGAADLGAIFAYMKLLDPGATVMEGDVAKAENTGGKYEQGWNLYNKIRSGGLLTPKMRADFRNEGAKLFGANAKQYEKTAQRYRGFAKQRGYTEDDVATLLQAPQAAAAPKEIPPNIRKNAQGKWVEVIEE